jgi:hypothetical protein
MYTLWQYRWIESSMSGMSISGGWLYTILHQTILYIVARFANAGWMTFRNLKERDCNSSGALRVLRPLPSPRYGSRAR